MAAVGYETPLSVEATFRNARITSQTTMADTVIAGLDTDAAAIISDLIMCPDPVAPYTRIKERIISTFSTSAEAKLRKLLKGQVAANGKPSHTLATMRNLNNGSCPDNVLGSIFLDLMPEQCRAILAASKYDDLQELASLADTIVETIDPAAVNAVAAGKSRPCSMQEQVDQLSRDVAKFFALVDGRHRSRARSASRGAADNPLRRRSRSRDPAGLCRLHAKYGDRAFRCIKPCAWSGTPPTSEN
ncbi:uncharacterized protein LOC143209861 [Lasioglossum baleicum]|uniref:uncharacterized protein LOC143209861 n=1 Tax=Lasioglossum baleicum TaxID=434251 RepID=UPI003FCE2432